VLDDAFCRLAEVAVVDRDRLLRFVEFHQRMDDRLAAEGDADFVLHRRASPRSQHHGRKRIAVTDQFDSAPIALQPREQRRRDVVEASRPRGYLGLCALTQTLPAQGLFPASTVLKPLFRAASRF